MKPVTNFKELIEFENAIKQRNFEIDLFWKRSWFFGVLVIAEITAYYKLKTDNQIILALVTSFITCLTMLAQCLMNRGSKYWQERWEYMTLNREDSLNIELTKLKKFDDTELNNWLYSKYQYNKINEWFFIQASILSKAENKLTSSHRFSVSKITFLVWDVIFLCSLLCWLNEAFLITSSNPDWSLTFKLSLFYILICGYIIAFWCNGKVYEPFKKEFKNMSKEEIAEIEDKYLRNDIKSPFEFISNEQNRNKENPNDSKC